MALVEDQRTGYWERHVPGRGMVREHRLVMEAHIGRLLRSDEVVHHTDHNRSNNRIENLELMTIPAHHDKHRNSNNTATHYQCSRCREVLPLDDFYKNRAMTNGRSNYCRPCHKVACCKSQHKHADTYGIDPTTV